VQLKPEHGGSCTLLSSIWYQIEGFGKNIITNTSGGCPFCLGQTQATSPTISRTVTLLLGAQKSLAGAPYHFAYTIVHFWSFEEGMVMMMMMMMMMMMIMVIMVMDYHDDPDDHTNGW